MDVPIEAIRNEIKTEIDGLSVDELNQLLQYTRVLKRSRRVIGEPAENLFQYSGLFSDHDLEQMSKAIEDCEQIDHDEW